jgi:hypothetical protein
MREGTREREIRECRRLMGTYAFTLVATPSKGATTSGSL